MSARNLDKHNRFRSITVGFRVSPEESVALNKIVALSGLSKQEYCYQKCMNREIVVQGSPKVYKALYMELKNVLAELQRIGAGECVDPDLLEVIDQINVTIYGMKEENHNTVL